MFESTRPTTRKHFVKCVDCLCQTLPRNASAERLWASAAMLHMRGRVNEGALCFKCANKRREMLGLPLDTEPVATENAGPACQTGPKKLRINSREVTWEIGTLEAVVTKCDEFLHEGFKNKDPRFLLVAVNNKVIRAKEFSVTPISDGDEITIVVGAIAGG